MKSLYKMWKTKKENHKNKEILIRRFNEGGIALSNIKCSFNANILINNSGVLYNTPIESEYFFIPIENIRRIQVKNDVELSKQVIANKIPIVGSLNFKRQIHFFLIIKYIENNLELEKNIESEMAEVGADEILKARKHYIKNNSNSSVEQLYYSVEPISQNEEFKTLDIPDQISKLFELVEKGVITLEEFNQKKKELLSRM